MKYKSLLLSILVTIIFGGLYYYLAYPALNITNVGFWVFLLILVAVFTVVYTVTSLQLKFQDLVTKKKTYRYNHKPSLLIFAIPVVILGILLVNFVLSPLFFANKYYQRITVSDAEFTENVKEVDFNKIPLLDRASSEKLGDRTMGQMSELVSQFDVSNKYTQINYNDEIIRVTPLEYNGWIKWLTNRKNGIKGYITVNSTDGEAKLVKLDKGMKYAPSGLFNENLYRKLQLSYPTYNFESVNFEIDNEGKPYWVASVVKYVGVGIRRDVSGVVILDPVTGKSKYYEVKDIPTWVDHVYESDLILEQIDDWGKYKNGFINSLIGQRDVVMATDGYNYLAQDDDIYLYTGITSVVSDESNVGFILTNMRTKETKFYGVAGAEEYSAMDSAKGQVQQMNYTSTFPLLINLNNKPTYLISLKDNAGLVKMYAFVDVVDYQKVVVTDSSKGIKKAAEAYLNEMNDDIVGNNSREVVINNISTAIIDGNTYYYFNDNNGQKYKVSIKTGKNKLPFVKNGDTLNIKFDKEVEVITITEIE
ncbi:MAG: CvpA family protein [Bacilli bacterium]|nr:CvpA family protein [Bacilli bacterium]